MTSCLPCNNRFKHHSPGHISHTANSPFVDLSSQSQSMADGVIGVVSAVVQRHVEMMARNQERELVVNQLQQMVGENVLEGTPISRNATGIKNAEVSPNSMFLLLV